MRRALTPFLVSTLVLATTSSAVFALPVARLRSVRPVVEIAASEKNAFRVAKNRNALVFGDIVRTGVGGKADILFNNGTQIAMRERTQIQILAPATVGKPLVVRVFGALGEVFVRAKGPTEIRTAAGTAAVRGTQFLIQLDAPEKTTLTVSEGSVAFTNQFGEVLVNQNQQSSATTTTAPTAPVLIDPSGLLAWSFDITALPAANLTAGETEALQLIQGNQAAEAIKVIARTPEREQSANSRAINSLALLVQGNSRRARSEAKKAVELDPFSSFALLALGRSELSRNDLDEARQAFEQASALSPENALFQNELGAIYARLDLLPKAKKAYTATLALNPNDAVALAGLATVEGKTGEVETARKNFARALELAPRNASVRAQYANFLVEQGQLKEAARIGRELLEIKGGSEPTAELGALYIRLSEASLFDQKLNDALEYAKNAVKVLPDSAPANYQLGRVFLEQGRSIQAQNQFRYATILDPDYHAARYALGLVQDQIAQGRNGQSALGSAVSNTVSSQNSLFSVENAIQPGANERVQALVSDPTVARTASRSFGDLQIDAVGGSKSFVDGEVSYLKEGSDDRSVLGVNANYSAIDGIRPSADRSSDIGVVSYGVKDEDSPTGTFLQFQNRRNTWPTDDGPQSSPSQENDSRRDRAPHFLAGFNFQKTQKTQARFLFQGGQSHYFSTNGYNVGAIRFGFDTDNLNKDYSGDFRYDWQLSNAHRIVFGLSHSLIDRDESTSTQFIIPNLFSGETRNRREGTLRSTVAYVRDSWKLSDQLSLDGELKFRHRNDKVTNKTVLVNDGVPLPPTFLNEDTKRSSFVPTLLLTYRANRQSQLRLRYSQRIEEGAGWENLSPDDVFLYSQEVLPTLTGRENRTDLEYTHSIGGDTLLQVGAFYAQQTRSRGGYFIRDADFLGIRSNITGLLSKGLSYSVTAEGNFAKGRVTDNPANYLERANLANIPRFRGEVGLQYLADNGFFIQPSLAYIGASPEGASTDDNQYKRNSGFALTNLRVGKRYGLKYSLFAEVLNLFDKEYTVLYNGTADSAGLSRQYRVGLSSRF